MNPDNGTGEEVVRVLATETVLVENALQDEKIAASSGLASPASPSSLKTVVIRRSSKLDGLFKGFRRLRAISFGVSPMVVLELREKFGFEEIDLILGENLTSSYREQFAKDQPTLERLADLVTQGKVRIFIPRDGLVIHTKLYFLDNGAGLVRFVETSSNLTRTGMAGKQINHAIWGDLPEDDPLLVALQADYQAHLDLCEPFLGDLMDLLKKEKDKGKAIEAWLAASVPEAEVEQRKVVADVLSKTFDLLENAPSTPVTLELPSNSETARHLEANLFEPAHGRKIGEREYEVDAPALIAQFQRNVSGMPLLRVDPESNRVILWSDGKLHERSAAPTDGSAASRDLEHLERYVDTVRFGATAEPSMAKTVVWEALLALLSTPFAHEEMKTIRRKYRTEVVSRGPAILCLHGPSHNGKTTFLKFALKLLCGFPVEPLAGKDFRPARIRAYTAMGNLFPLLFDDVPTGHVRELETVVKSYWEHGGWNPEVPHPQLVLTTNREAFKSWAKTRMKKMAFDIEYDRSSDGTLVLSRLFEEPNDIFRGFAHLYLESLRSGEGDVLEDTLSRAREALLRLYEIAGRKVPTEFSRRPFEAVYDHEKRRWQDLLRLEKARVLRRKDELCVEFDAGFQSYEIVEYDQMLPQGIKSRRHANLIKIESPREFEAWIGKEFAARGFLSRFFGKLCKA